MKKVLQLLIAIMLTGNAADAQSSSPPILGRWDLTIDAPGPHRAGWLEVRKSGRSTLVGQVVGPSGSTRPISRVDFQDGQMRFSIPPQWENVQGEIAFAGRLEGESLRGTMTMPDGRSINWRGVRAPSLRRATAPKWGAPVRLIAPSGLTGWRVVEGANEWEVAGGVLRNRKSGGNLVTDRTFTDFKLHAEFRYPKGGNSGIYLRGRYELQIADTPREELDEHALGGIYGFLAPSRTAALGPNEWQSFDITLVGRLVTVVLNGKTIIQDREIPGITGGALDSDEGAPGPLLLQGDHGPIEFRNLTVTPAQ